MAGATRERATIGTVTLKRAEGDDDSRVIEGYALKFNEYSQNFGGWFEIIEPGALDGVLDISDVRALFNHDPNHTLARARPGSSKNTLVLTVDEIGLHYRFTAGNTAIANDLVEMLERGDVSQSSFQFSLKDWAWINDDDKGEVRVIKKFKKIFDVCPVTFPAYTNTEATVRSFEEYQNVDSAKSSWRMEAIKRRLQIIKLS